MIAANMARSSAQARPGFLVNMGKKITLLPYTKNYLSYPDQLELLRGRGLLIENAERALWHLETAGYYRLSGYFYPFRTPSQPLEVNGKMVRQPRLSTFVEGTTFEQVSMLYWFDNKFRLLVLTAIEKLEIAVRAKIAHHMCAKNPCAHLIPDFMHPKFRQEREADDGQGVTSNYAKWITNHDRLITRSKEDFIKHFRDRYVPPIPLWVSIEVWDFGLLSHFFSGLNDKDKAAIALSYNVDRFALLASWIRSISLLRNICAHHSRLWNRNISDNPKPPGRREIPMLEHLVGVHSANSRDHVYGTLAVMQYLLLAAGFGTEWAAKLKELMATFPSVTPQATEQTMGFPEGWAELELWATT